MRTVIFNSVLMSGRQTWGVQVQPSAENACLEHISDWKTLTSPAPAVAAITQTPLEGQGFFLSVWPHSTGQSVISSGLHAAAKSTLGLRVWKLGYEVATEHPSLFHRSKLKYLCLWHWSHLLWKYPLGIRLLFAKFVYDVKNKTWTDSVNLINKIA